MSHKTHTFSVKVNYTLTERHTFQAQCPGFQYVPSVLPAVKRIIVIGDIHGDLDLAVRYFKANNLIDDRLEWVAKPSDTVVVQVGDQIDSCRPAIGSGECKVKHTEGDLPEDVKVMEFFDTMHKKASVVGGAVYSLLGNHEIMNSQGDFNYVSYENKNNFEYNGHRGETGRRDAFAPGGSIAKQMACTRKTVLIIGSNLFVHAGIMPKLAYKLDQLDISNEDKVAYLNKAVREWLLNEVSHDKVTSTVLNDMKLSPFWARVYGSIPEHTSMTDPKCADALGQVLSTFKVGSLIVGHTPQITNGTSNINGTCAGPNGVNKLYRVDGGFAKAFKVENGSKVQVLEILNDNEFNIITAS